MAAGAGDFSPCDGQCVFADSGGSATRAVYRIDERHQSLQPQTSTQSRATMRVSVPYIPGTSDVLSHMLIREGIQMAQKLISTLGRLMLQPKD